METATIAIIPPLHEDFVVQRLEEKHYDQVMDVFTRAFCDSEPMTKYINMQYDEFRPFADAVLQKAFADKLSAVIVEKKTGHVAALGLSEDLADPAALNISLTDKFVPIFTLLEQLSSHYFAKHPPQKNQVAHLFITAVDKKFRGRKLSIHVNFYAMHLAKERDFSYMVSELTNYLNEKGIIPHLTGYKECIGDIVYRDFELENKKPFANLDGHAHAFLWELPDVIRQG